MCRGATKDSTIWIRHEEGGRSLWLAERLVNASRLNGQASSGERPTSPGERDPRRPRRQRQDRVGSAEMDRDSTTWKPALNAFAITFEGRITPSEN